MRRSLATAIPRLREAESARAGMAVGGRAKTFGACGYAETVATRPKDQDPSMVVSPALHRRTSEANFSSESDREYREEKGEVITLGRTPKLVDPPTRKTR